MEEAPLSIRHTCTFFFDLSLGSLVWFPRMLTLISAVINWGSLTPCAIFLRALSSRWIV
jgi:hypothetical protein